MGTTWTKENILNSKLDSQEGLVLQKYHKNLSGSNKNRTMKHTKSAYLKTYLFRWRASLLISFKFMRTLSNLIPLNI